MLNIKTPQSLTKVFSRKLKFSLDNFINNINLACFSFKWTGPWAEKVHSLPRSDKFPLAGDGNSQSRRNIQQETKNKKKSVTTSTTTKTTSNMSNERGMNFVLEKSLESRLMMDKFKMYQYLADNANDPNERLEYMQEIERLAKSSASTSLTTSSFSASNKNNNNNRATSTTVTPISFPSVEADEADEADEANEEQEQEQEQQQQVEDGDGGVESDIEKENPPSAVQTSAPQRDDDSLRK